MAVGQLQIFRDPPLEWLNGGYLLLLVGLGCVLVAIRKLTVYPDLPLVTPMLRPPVRIKRFWLGVSIALSGFIALRSVTTPPVAYLGEYLLVWALAIMALLWAVRMPNAEQTDQTALHRWEYGLLVGLFVVGFLIRGTALETMPAFLDQDEAYFAQQGAYSRVADHFLVDPFAPGFHSYALLHASLISLSTGVFGDTLLGARLPSAILGTLGVLAIYLLGRELYHWQVGLMAAFFALTWPFQIIFSRLALNQPGDPLFATLAFYFLVRGLRRNRSIDFALSGIMLGIAQLFYLGGRLAIVVMAAYLAFLWLRRRVLISSQWRLIALIPLAALIVTLPQNFYQLYFRQPITTHTDPSIFSGRLQEAINAGPTAAREYLTKQFGNAFEGLFSAADQGGWYGSGANLMGPIGGPLLLSGFVVSLGMVRKKPEWILTCGWVLMVILIGVALTTYSPQYQRYFPGVSALALLVGIGATAILSGAIQLFRLAAKSVWFVPGLATVLLLANAIFYFGIYIPTGRYIDNRPNRITNRVAQDMLAAYDAGKQIFLLDRFNSPAGNSNVIKYFMMGKPYTLIYDDATEAAYKAIDPEKPYLFIIVPARIREMDDLIRLLPSGNPSYVIVPGEDSPAYYKYER